jgi:transposase-like protein
MVTGAKTAARHPVPPIDSSRPDMDQIVLSLSARGLRTREISAHFAEVYGSSVSRETASKITDQVLEEMGAWISPAA